MKNALYVILLIFGFSCVLYAAEPTPKLEFVDSITEVFGDPNALLARPVRIKVTNSVTGEGVKGVPLHFFSVTSPKGASPLVFPNEIVLSDEQGFADANVVLGSKKGEYVAGVSLAEDSLGKPLYFSVQARAEHWIGILLMEILAGLALFMFGIWLLAEGMRKSAGRALRRGMKLLTSNRIIALSMGAAVTVVLQSSTATTVMLVGFVQAGLLTFRNTLGVILGADIGTTMTVQLIAFKLTDYALIPITVGFFIWTVYRSELWKQIGQTILGAGLVFFGMAMMTSSISPLRTHQPFLSVIPHFSNPVVAIFVGAVFTAILHSSAAFIAIVIVFAAQHLLSLETGIALCLGANIGTCVTAILASFNASTEAKRVAAGHTLFKILGVLLVLPWIPYFAKFVSWASGGSQSVERTIANAHTLFNIGIGFAFLPFLTPFDKLVCWLIPEKKKTSRTRTVLDDALVATPALALAATKVEVLRVGRDAQAMVECSLAPVFKNTRLAVEDLKRRESEVDDAYDDINLYLKKIMASEGDADRLEEAFQLMSSANDFEQIADLVEDRIIPAVEKLHQLDRHFSEAGQQELKNYHIKTLKQISRAIDVLATADLEKAEHISKRFEKYRKLASEFQQTHFRRLQQQVKEAEDTSEIHLEILAALLEISDLATNIARSLLERQVLFAKA